MTIFCSRFLLAFFFFHLPFSFCCQTLVIAVLLYVNLERSVYINNNNNNNFFYSPPSISSRRSRWNVTQADVSIIQTITTKLSVCSICCPVYIQHTFAAHNQIEYNPKKNAIAHKWNRSKSKTKQKIKNKSLCATNSGKHVSFGNASIFGRTAAKSFVRCVELKYTSTTFQFWCDSLFINVDIVECSRHEHSLDRKCERRKIEKIVIRLFLNWVSHV